jgi:hypothetical protein
MPAGRSMGADSMEEKAAEAARHTSNESAVTTCFFGTHATNLSVQNTAKLQSHNYYPNVSDIWIIIIQMSDTKEKHRPLVPVIYFSHKEYIYIYFYILQCFFLCFMFFHCQNTNSYTTNLIPLAR